MRMSVAVIGSRGRLVLPREVRDALGVREGDTVFFLLEGEQVRLAAAPEDFGEYMRLLSGPRPAQQANEQDDLG
jgi:AbrB family looped-hinge helix DNA binding protein